MTANFGRQGGLFHSGVEVYKKEWSYGQVPWGTGVECCAPRQNDQHTFRESLYLGDCQMKEMDVLQIVDELMCEWLGTDYDLLQQNCNHFANEFCSRLGVGEIPSWVNQFARRAGSSRLLTASVKTVQSLGSSTNL